MQPHEKAAPSTDAMLAVWSLWVDQLSAELTQALDRRGVGSILLKGPSFGSWLYGDGVVRPYADCDLLIAPGDLTDAQRVLRDLGFTDTAAPMGHPRLESHAWRRGEHSVDLHTTLIGIRASPNVVWETLSSMSESTQVGGSQVRVLTAPARALHVVLHAAQHGREDQKPLEDLRRAVALVPEEEWSEVLLLAQRLQAVEAFATGLRLDPAGARLASRLGLDTVTSPDATLRLEPVPLALAFEHLASVPSWRARLEILLRELFPTVAFMRWWSPLARRGRAGLVAAYCWRPLWLLAHVVPGLLAWRQARRTAG